MPQSTWNDKRQHHEPLLIFKEAAAAAAGETDGDVSAQSMKQTTICDNKTDNLSFVTVKPYEKLMEGYRISPFMNKDMLPINWETKSEFENLITLDNRDAKASWAYFSQVILPEFWSFRPLICGQAGQLSHTFVTPCSSSMMTQLKNHCQCQTFLFTAEVNVLLHQHTSEI